MFKKFSSFSDDEIVLAYKNQIDDDLEAELMSRYKIHARKLAGELKHKFAFLYQVEYEDVYCIVSACVFVAVNSFKKGMKNFFKYWKNVATREVYNYVGQFTTAECNSINELVTASNGEERNYFYMMKQNESSLIEDYPLISDIVHVIEKDKKHFESIDKEVFYLYVEGYSLYEIAVTLNLTYSSVRRRVNKLKDKISDILFNQ